MQNTKVAFKATLNQINSLLITTKQFDISVSYTQTGCNQVKCTSMWSLFHFIFSWKLFSPWKFRKFPDPCGIFEFYFLCILWSHKYSVKIFTVKSPIQQLPVIAIHSYCNINDATTLVQCLLHQQLFYFYSVPRHN